MSISLMARLAAWLRRGHSRDRREVEAALRQRVEEARAAARAWKARALAADARREDLVARLASADRALRVAKGEVVKARREEPSVAVAGRVFSQRLRTVAARTSTRSVPGLEDTLIRASAPYRSALESSPDALRGVARRIDLDGLAWWVPARTKQARVPYRGILQTRDVSSGGLMLDLGANVGRMSVPRVVLGDVTAAYCAEPDPVSFACLARNVIDNGLRGLVLPDQTAIGDRNGTAQLLREGASGNFRLLREGAVDARNVVDVPCCTLDTWVERLGIDLDAVTFIKVDVEGSERRLVAGAGRVLSCAHIAWQMEVKPSGLRAAGDEPGDLYVDLQRRFTHFTDLNRRAVGKRVRSIADLPEALRYIEPDGKTDVLLFSADGLV
jgi:FkbM family methyltransferase